MPLASVWYGEDAELLERLLDFYPRKKPRKILDATVNGGRFWRDSKRRIIGVDIDRRHRPTIVADNTAMPFGDGTLDVIVYDPPHIPIRARITRRISALASGWCSGLEGEPLHVHAYVSTIRPRGASTAEGRRNTALRKSPTTSTTTVTSGRTSN